MKKKRKKKERKEPFCRLSNQHEAARTSDFCSQLNGRRKQGRAGEEERRKRQQRECDRAVMEGWGGGEEGMRVERCEGGGGGGGSLNLLQEEVWRERIREDREGSVSNLTAVSLPTSAH